MQESSESLAGKTGASRKVIESPILITILAGVMSLSGTFVGAKLANEGTLTEVRQQAQQQSEDSDRQKRADTYGDFIKQASLITSNFATSQGCAKATTEDPAAQETDICNSVDTSTTNSFSQMYYDFTLLEAYGTPGSVTAADELFLALRGSETEFDGIKIANPSNAMPPGVTSGLDDFVYEMQKDLPSEPQPPKSC